MVLKFISDISEIDVAIAGSWLERDREIRTEHDGAARWLQRVPLVPS
jgi:hypothetical protein